MALLGQDIGTHRRLLIHSAKLLSDKAPCVVVLFAFSASRIPDKSSKSLGMIQPPDQINKLASRYCCFLRLGKELPWIPPRTWNSAAPTPGTFVPAPHCQVPPSPALPAPSPGGASCQGGKASQSSPSAWSRVEAKEGSVPGPMRTLLTILAAGSLAGECPLPRGPHLPQHSDQGHVPVPCRAQDSQFQFLLCWS